ncbi:hypothetical protein CR513_12478, partial [Mucuna pruriens]
MDQNMVDAASGLRRSRHLKGSKRKIEKPADEAHISSEATHYRPASTSCVTSVWDMHLAISEATVPPEFKSGIAYITKVWTCWDHARDQDTRHHHSVNNRISKCHHGRIIPTMEDLILQFQQNIIATIHDFKIQVGQLVDIVSQMQSAGSRSIPS